MSEPRTTAYAPASGLESGGLALPRTTLLFLVLLIAAVAPVLWVDTPPLVDYPDHLARMHVIADGGRDAILARFYQIDWHLIPNLAMDLVVPPLTRLVGLYWAGKIYILALLGVLVSGVFAVHGALGRKADPFAFTVFLLLYSYAFLLGLMNYLMGVGILLWALAGWIWFREHSPWLRTGISFVAISALFLCHLFAVGLYGFALLCFEGWYMATHRKGLGLKRLVIDLACFGVPFLPVLPLVLFSPTGGLAGETVWSLGDKVEGLEWLFTGYDEFWDPIWAGAVGLVVACTAVCRGLKVHPVGWVVLFGGAALFMLMPNVLFGAWAGDVRLPVGIAFILICFVGIDFTDARKRMWFVGAIALLALVRFGMITASWAWMDKDINEMIGTFDQVRPGSRVLVAEADEWIDTVPRGRPMIHISCLLLVERSSFAADAFVQPGKQLLSVKPEFAAQANLQDGEEPAMSQLIDAKERPNKESDEYWSDWWRRFDYIYLIHTGRPGQVIPPELKLLRQGRRFELYSVVTAEPLSKGVD